MEKVTIKVKDGELTIPTVGKVYKNGELKTLYKVLPDRILYIYVSSFGYGSCSFDGWRREEFKDAKPCSKEFWNTTLHQYAFKHFEGIMRFVSENSL